MYHFRISLKFGKGYLFTIWQKGEQPIIMALPRGLKTRLDPELKNLLEKNRLLIIIPFESDVKRIKKETAAIRNQLMVEIADEIVVGYKNLME